MVFRKNITTVDYKFPLKEIVSFDPKPKDFLIQFKKIIGKKYHFNITLDTS